MAADKSRTDNPWSDDELDAIVTDYFTMLAAEQSGQFYKKSDHRLALMQKIDRSKGSIEFKHQNISAVLAQLGLPWIAGSPGFPGVKRLFVDQHGFLMRKNETDLTRIRVKT
ncbi:MAG: hypothetical protein WCJ55_14790, partial [Chloroflexales bacterium]